MIHLVWNWLRRLYDRIIGSIAFFPAIIAFGFLVLAYLMLEFDFSNWGAQLKLAYPRLSMEDPSTARTIVGTITGGVLSLTVFSFSMVMIVLNQAASNLSNRLLDSMIRNRFQQWVLGAYIGTIVYALFLLSTIQDQSSETNIPSLSIYLLIGFAILDIFLFIYFLDYVTQSVKFETIIHRIYQPTQAAMERACTLEEYQPDWEEPDLLEHKVGMPVSNYFQGADYHSLVTLCEQKDWFIRFYHEHGAYVLEGSPILCVYSAGALTEADRKELWFRLDLHRGQPLEKNPDYGFRQLMEVALKALSPGINDPATGVQCLHALANLLAYRLKHFLPYLFTDSQGVSRVRAEASGFPDLFERCVWPIWDYGQTDRSIQQALLEILPQLSLQAQRSTDRAHIHTLLKAVKSVQMPPK